MAFVFSLSFVSHQQAIEEAEAHITDLTTMIEELTAASARLNTEIKNLEGEVAKNQEALDEATAIREKQLAEFNEEEKDNLQAISALKAAIVVLSKHHPSLLQTEQVALVAAKVQQLMHKHSHILRNAITPKQRKTVASFIQAPS